MYLTRRQIGRALFVAASALAAGCSPFYGGALPGAPKGKTKDGLVHQYATIDGARIHFIDEGEGPPVVFVHGFASSFQTFRGVIADLRRDHRVIALDLKGFGYSARPEGDYSPKAQANVILHLLDRLGVEAASFIAHSWGSSVVLRLALEAPKRVIRVALLDAWVYEDQLPTFFHFARAPGVGEAIFSMFYNERSDEKLALAFYDKKLVTEELVESVEAQLSQPGTTAAALAAVRGQRYEEVERRYKDVTAPVLLLWGREDRISPLEYGERLSTDLPNARLVVYPRCGHFPMYEAKHATLRELRAFVTPIETASATPPVEAPKAVETAPPPVVPSATPSEEPAVGP